MRVNTYDLNRNLCNTNHLSLLEKLVKRRHLDKEMTQKNMALGPPIGSLCTMRLLFLYI